MKYEHPKDISAEYLRLAIPFMSKQDAAVDPVSYSVWYEYVSGINPALKQAVDELLEGREQLTDEDTERLFRDYISSCNIDAVDHVRKELCQVLQHTRKSTSEASEQTREYGQALEKYTLACTQAGQNSSLDSTIQAILTDTHHLHRAIHGLHQELDKSTHEMEALREELLRVRQEASSDPLTGLANRKAIDAALKKAISAQQQKDAGPLCLIMLDIDHFKQVNDSYGHLLGDKVICFVAGVMKKNVKGKDTAARCGGEEFCILLPDTDAEGARALAESIRKDIEGAKIRRQDNGETIGQVTISVGISCYQPGDDHNTFYERADQALYASKENGRNRTTGP